MKRLALNIPRDLGPQGLLCDIAACVQFGVKLDEVLQETLSAGSFSRQAQRSFLRRRPQKTYNMERTGNCLPSALLPVALSIGTGSRKVVCCGAAGSGLEVGISPFSG